MHIDRRIWPAISKLLQLCGGMPEVLHIKYVERRSTWQRIIMQTFPTLVFHCTSHADVMISCGWLCTVRWRPTSLIHLCVRLYFCLVLHWVDRRNKLQLFMKLRHISPPYVLTHSHTDSAILDVCLYGRGLWGWLRPSVPDSLNFGYDPSWGNSELVSEIVTGPLLILFPSVAQTSLLKNSYWAQRMCVSD